MSQFKFRITAFFIFFILIGVLKVKSQTQSVVYKNSSYILFRNAIQQGSFKAIVQDDHQIISNYKSPSNKEFSRLIQFKLSLNEKDNELPVGVNHWVMLENEHESELIKWGELPESIMPEANVGILPQNFEYTFRFDLSPVFESFQKRGFFEGVDGAKIAKEDFKGVYLAGNVLPLTWDFVNLGGHRLKLEKTINENIYELRVIFNPDESNPLAENSRTFTKSFSKYPQLKTSIPIVDVLYNMSLEELDSNIESDSTFRTGALWAGVWTRDISYSILLSGAYFEPEIAKISLMQKTKNGKIIQDTGSGGAWPISSDRMIWAVAAYEVFKVTGDEKWLKQILPYIKKSIDDDAVVLATPGSTLLRGESSFLDWREQSYPKWMDNVAIYNSLNLSTNVVHFQAINICGLIMKRLNMEGYDHYIQRAEQLKKDINLNFWNESKGFYNQYLYGWPYLTASTKFETLGNALAILFDVANKDQAATIVSKAPQINFGISCFYPQISGISSYHNNAIWPFVQSFWNLASKKAQNEKSLLHGIGAIYRPSLLFLTNYENFSAETGDYKGTEINSHRMLWSITGSLAVVLKAYFGINFEENGISFSPSIPKTMAGNYQLNQFKYKDYLLNISVEGFGNQIRSFEVNGNKSNVFAFTGSIDKNINIKINLTNSWQGGNSIYLVENEIAPTTPSVVDIKSDILDLLSKSKRNYYVDYFRNGKKIDLSDPNLKSKLIYDGIYQKMVIGEEDFESFKSQPHAYFSNSKIIEAESFAPLSLLSYKLYSGNGFVELSIDKNSIYYFDVEVENEGTYLIDFRYSNGSGPWNTDNKCALRSLYLDNDLIETCVFPQRGQDSWSDWGYSNQIFVKLKKGVNHLSLKYMNWNENMNIEVNTAMLDFVRIRKVE